MSSNKLKIEEFNTKLKTQVDYTVSEKVRLQISPSNVTLLQTLYGDPLTPNTWCYVWVLYSDKNEKRTTNVVKAINTMRKNIEKVLRIICNDIPASFWNDTDRSTYGRKTGAFAKATHKIVQILSLVYSKFIAAGLGKGKLKCYTEADASRANMHPDANEVEVIWKIFDPVVEAQNAGTETVGKIKKLAQPLPLDCTNKAYSPTAVSIVDFGEENSGLIAQGYLRWYNTHQPALSGPYGEMFSFKIP